MGVAVLIAAGLALLTYRALLLPRVYYEVAFVLIRSNSLMADRLDWETIHADALAELRGHWKTQDAYPAVRLVLARLGDGHSHFATPELVRAYREGAAQDLGLVVLWPERVVAVVSRDGPAADAGVRVGDRLEVLEGREPSGTNGVVALRRFGAPSRLTFSRPGRTEHQEVVLTPRVVAFNRPAEVRRLGEAVGYVEIPGVVGAGGSFDREAVDAIRGIDSAAMCGWVVDLRRNAGGNMWPMLHALRPILGEENPFTYQYGKGPFDGRATYALKRPDPAIAVLLSRLTVSSGELVAIAFRGPATTRFFGEPTAGLSTSNLSIPMVDGARLVVTTTRARDRTGRVYEGAIEPDVAVATDWTRFAEPEDPALAAALTWLRDEQGCAVPLS